MDEECEERARILWDYLCLHQRLEKSGVIIGLGCHDLRVAESSAALFLKKKKIYFIDPCVWTRPEAEDEQLNIRFSHRVLKERNIPVSKVILVQQPFMERRVYATFMCQWPSNFDYSHPTVGTASDLICYMLSTVYHLFFSAMLGVREMDWLGWLLPK
uniref:DUF218 domain-containing protein n=1 Tax=Labrus bergylta TaxID=56723 RepID=A0A3Q3ES39_9LABR